VKGLYILLLTAVYSLAFLQPYAPYLQYAVQKEYIAKVLCQNKSVPGSTCQGRCYLNKQLSKSNQPDPFRQVNEIRSLAPHNIEVDQLDLPAGLSYESALPFLIPISAFNRALLTPPPQV
jgi:hypothetical protein